MRRPVRRSRLLALASLTTILVGTMLLTVGPVAAAGPSSHPFGQEPTRRGGELRAGARPAFRHVDVSALPAATREDQSSSRALLNPMTGVHANSQIDAAAAPHVVDLAAGTASPATEVTAFPGLAYADPPGFEPPDPWVAVGPEHVIQAVNTTFRISDRSGTTLSTVDMYDFFGLDDVQQPYFAELFDPRVIYDSLHGRWVAVEASFDCLTDAQTSVGTGYIDIATSDSADPMGTWRIFSIFYTDAVPDYPGLGTSTDKIAVSANVFGLLAGGGANGCQIDDSPTGFIASDVEVMAWSEMLGGGVVDLESFNGVNDFPASNVTWRPAVQTPATSANLSLVAFDAVTNAILFSRITGSPAGASLSSMSNIIDLSAASILAPVMVPPQPQQPGSPATIAGAVDERLTDAIWQNNLLTTVSTYPCDAAPISTYRDCVRVSQLNTGPTTPAVRQDILIGEDDKDLYMGGVGYAGNGDLHISWTRSSAAGTDYPSSYITRQPAAGPVNVLAKDDATGPYGTLTGAGTGTYPSTRWGDYVGVAQDPQVPNAVWQANQYSAGASFWATNVSQLQTAGATYVPIAPLRVLDSRINRGVTGIFTASNPKSFTVAGFTSSGGSIPADAIAVTGNVTVVGQTAGGYVSVTTTPTSTPGSSTLNFPVKDTRANNLTAPVASNGTLSVVYKAAAGKKAHLVFDVTGYFLPGTEDAAYNTLAPVRVLDSRVAYGIGLINRFHTGVPRRLVIANRNGVPSNAVAVTANLTVVGQTKSGFVSITPTSVPNPTTSNINFPVGDTRANGLTTKLGSGGDIWLVYKGSAAGSRTDLILDVTGYYLQAGSGLVFHALNPGRIMDTRTSVLSGLTGTFNHDVSRALGTDGHWGVPVGAKAVTGNLTVTGQTRKGYVSITPDPDPAPTTSTINFPLGDTRANGVTVPLNGTGNMSLIYKAAAGKKTHLVLDVTGYFE